MPAMRRIAETQSSARKLASSSDHPGEAQTRSGLPISRRVKICWGFSATKSARPRRTASSAETLRSLPAGAWGTSTEASTMASASSTGRPCLSAVARKAERRAAFSFSPAL